MAQLVLKPNNQTPEDKSRKSIDALSVAVLAVSIFLIFGGLIYGAGKISDFSQKISNFNSFSDYNIPNDQNIIFRHNSQNANSAARNVNKSLGNDIVNQFTNQAPINSSIGADNNCVDSDAGLLSRDIYASGVTTLTSIGGQSVTTAYDSCRDNFTVEEVKCWKGANGDNSYYLQRIPYPCSKGCLNGACEAD